MKFLHQKPENPKRRQAAESRKVQQHVKSPKVQPKVKKSKNSEKPKSQRMSTNQEVHISKTIEYVKTYDHRRRRRLNKSSRTSLKQRFWGVRLTGGHSPLKHVYVLGTSWLLDETRDGFKLSKICHWVVPRPDKSAQMPVLSAYRCCRNHEMLKSH